MKYLLFLMFSIIMNMFIITSPIMMLLMILVTSFFMSLLVAFKFSSWYGFLMFLIYIGGMLVMFSYFVALTPNQYNNFKKLLFMPIFFFLLFINNFFMNMYSNKLNYMYMVTYMYENNNMLTTMFLIILLLLMMFMITKMVNLSKGPLRPFKYVYKNMKKNIMLKIFYTSIIELPSPVNISIWWNYGFLLGTMLLIQLITGIFMSFHYSTDMLTSFYSVFHMERNVNYGWLIRSMHINGASMFFMLMYIHMGRGIYYFSFYLKKTWNIGIILYLLSMSTAFMGYVLPWGQMSFWGATVITNLLSTIPYVGQLVVEWLWGGYSLGNPTLNRFFSIHFMLPFIMIFFVLLHLLFLHQSGSNNPLGFNSNSDRIYFYPYYLFKDLLGACIIIFMLMNMIFMYPNLFMEPENFFLANSTITPSHIKPEWYFLWLYAILRSIPNKLGGVMAAIMSIMILLLLPKMMMSKLSSMSFYYLNKFMFIMLLFSFFFLTWIGSCLVEEPYIMIGQITTFLYFLFYLMNPIIIYMWDNL